MSASETETLADALRRVAFLVGEDNPHSSDPRMALYPRPGTAGSRLATILSMSESVYMRTFARVNLCSGSWNTRLAKASALGVLSTASRAGVSIVLLGSRVCKSFGVAFEPFAEVRVGDVQAVVLPHPSGRCRIWNDAATAGRAASAVAQILPHLRQDRA